MRRFLSIQKMLAAGFVFSAVGLLGCDAVVMDPLTLPDDGTVPSDPCSLAPCQNGGRCNVDGDAFGCECAVGFEGPLCETNINDCPANACENGGLCIDGVGSYSCSCPIGFGGSRCEVDLDMRLLVPTRLVLGKPLTLRAELLDPATAAIVTDGCFDTFGTVEVRRLSDGVLVPFSIVEFDDHLSNPVGAVRFYHGVGSVSLTLDSGATAGDYQVTVTSGDRSAMRKFTVSENPTWRVMPANLTGADLTWGPDEFIRLSQHNTTVQVGSTLKILPGTLVMVDTTGSLEDGTVLTVNGKIEAAGSFDKPIAFFSERGARAMTHIVSGSSLSNPDSWRGIFLSGNGTSSLKWVMLTGAGNGPIVSHPRPPIINIGGTHNLTVEDSVFTDSTGMVFQSPGTGTTEIRRSLISRVGIGAEFLSNGNKVLIEDTYWTGIGRGPDTPLRYDGDGIHVDGTNSQQTIRRSFIVDIGDDAIDHSNSTFTIEDTVIHNSGDKGISMTNGLATLRNVLMYDTGTGVRGTARIYNSTILSPTPVVTPQAVVDSILWTGTISSCDGDVHHNILGSGSDLSCGVGNFSQNPRFLNPAKCDYSLAAGSPALNASSTLGPLGFVKW